MPVMAPATRPIDDPTPDDGATGSDAERLDGVGRLHLALPSRPDMTRTRALLSSPEAPWLGERLDEASGPMRDYACDLELPVGDMGPIIFRKSAIVGLGEPARNGTGWLIPIEWHAASFKPLFPVFAGTLSVLEDHIALDGHYAPPGGRLGAVLDAALLKVAARGTGRWFLRTVAAALAA
jgi:hypothetical protein